jgi:hypothetical protein
MSPASSSISISISTLRFAQNARKVRNQAKINVIFDDEKILIRKHHEKIASLTQELDLLKKQLAIETVTLLHNLSKFNYHRKLASKMILNP